MGWRSLVHGPQANVWKSDAPERGVDDRPAARSSFSHVSLTQVYARMAVPSCWETCPSSQTRTDVRTQWQRLLRSWDVGDPLLSVNECIVQKGSVLIGGAAGSRKSRIKLVGVDCLRHMRRED